MSDIDLSALQLVEVVRGDGSQGCTRHYRMKEPGTRINCVELLQAGGYVIIAGDFVPVRNGSVSAVGYDLGWFAQATSPDYLAEKFLVQRWIPKAAAEEIRWWVKSGEHPKIHTELNDLAAQLEYDGMDRGQMFEVLHRLKLYDESDVGWGYCPREVARLVAIQRRWAQLWKEHNYGRAEVKCA